MGRSIIRAAHDILILAVTDYLCPKFHQFLLYMNKRIIFLYILLVTGLFHSLKAQEIAHLTKMDITVKGVLPPLSPIADSIKKDIEWEDEVISLYYVKGKDAALLDHLRTIRKGLQRINKTNTQEEIKNEITPQITQLEEMAARPYSKKDRHLYHACLLSLVNTHRMVNNLDKASHFNQILITENYIPCSDITAQLAQQKERSFRYQQFQKTGIDPIQQRWRSQTNWINTITQTGRCEGYIVLKNNEMVKGELIDLFTSLSQMVVNIKYEKTLNDPIQNKTYSLADIKTIHTDQFVLAIIPHNDYLYIGQIIAESPQLLLAETLPIANLTPIKAKESHYMQFVQKRNNEWEAAVFESEIEKGLTTVLKDCPQVALRTQYDYYTIHQVQEAFNDYEKLCGDTSSQKVASLLANKTPSRQIKTTKSRTPDYSFGFSTGSNNFASLFGVNASFRIHQQLYGRIGAGGGAWGAKLAVGLKYDMQNDMRYRSGWSFCLGYAYNTGMKNTFETSISSKDSAVTNVNSASATVRPLPIRTLSASTIFTKYINQRVSYHLELGYSLPLTSKPWEIIEGDGTNKGIQKNIKLLKPGGFIVAVGMNFGF